MSGTGTEKEGVQGQEQGVMALATDDAPSAHDESTPALSLDAIHFGLPDSPDNIVYSEDKSQIKGATLPKLIEKLSEAKTDVKLIFDFLLTYRTYASPDFLVALLRKRFECPPPPQLKGDDLQKFLTSEQTIVRIKTINVVKQWVEKHSYDWIGEEGVVEAFEGFLDPAAKVPTTAKMADQLTASIAKKRQQTDESAQTREKTFSTKPPPPELPSEADAAKLNLFAISPLELARQMTLVEWEIWQSIRPWEFLNQAWTKKDKEYRAPQIIKMIKHFNFMGSWVGTEIVRSDTAKERGRVIARLLQVAEACKEIGNFNGVMEILSGLGNSGVFRLKASWEEVPPKCRTTYQELKTMMAPDGSFRNFREQLKSINPPTIPYLGIFLTDLIFINDGSKNFLSGADGQPSKLINFTKCRMVAHAIADIMQYQQTAYNYQMVPSIQEYLLNAEAWEEESIYATSLFQEPRPGTPQGDRPFPRRLFSATSGDPTVAQMAKLIIDRSELRAATLPMIVYHMLHVERFEVVMNGLLATYRSFDTAAHIFKAMASILTQANETADQAPTSLRTIPEWRRVYLPKTRRELGTRILHVCYKWLLEFIDELLQEKGAVPAFEEFCKGALSQFLPTQAPQLLKQLDLSAKRPKPPGAATSRPSVSHPKPFIPTNIPGLPSILDFHAEEVARQLALAGQELMQALPVETLFEFTKGPGSDPPAVLPPPLAKAQAYRQKLGAWLKVEVASKTKKLKTAAVDHLTLIATHALDFQDLLSASEFFEYLYMLQFSDVWTEVSKITTENFAKLKNVFERAHERGSVRNKLASLNLQAPALLPIGWLLEELTALRKLPDKRPAPVPPPNGAGVLELINFDKMARLGRLLTVHSTLRYHSYNYLKLGLIMCAALGLRRDYITGVVDNPAQFATRKATVAAPGAPGPVTAGEESSEAEPSPAGLGQNVSIEPRPPQPASTEPKEPDEGEHKKKDKRTGSSFLAGLKDWAKSKDKEKDPKPKSKEKDPKAKEKEKADKEKEKEKKKAEKAAAEQAKRGTISGGSKRGSGESLLRDRAITIGADLSSAAPDKALPATPPTSVGPTPESTPRKTSEASDEPPASPSGSVDSAHQRSSSASASTSADDYTKVSLQQAIVEELRSLIKSERDHIITMLDTTLKPFAEGSEAISGLKKELKEIQDIRAEVERLKALIEKKEKFRDMQAKFGK